MPAINKTKGSADRIKMKIRKGDTVQVISGKDKGKTGEVLKTLPVSYTHLTLPTNREV